MDLTSLNCWQRRRIDHGIPYTAFEVVAYGPRHEYASRYFFSLSSTWGRFFLFPILRDETSNVIIYLPMARIGRYTEVIWAVTRHHQLSTVGSRFLYMLSRTLAVRSCNEKLLLCSKEYLSHVPLTFWSSTIALPRASVAYRTQK